MTGAQAIQELLYLGYRFQLMSGRELHLRYPDCITPPPLADEYTQAIKADIPSAIWLVDLIEKGYEPVVFPEQTIEVDDSYTLEAYRLAEKRCEVAISRAIKQQKGRTTIVFRPLIPPCFIDIDRYRDEVTPVQTSLCDM